VGRGAGFYGSRGDFHFELCELNWFTMVYEG
jgi:hypothetical protein